MFETALRVNTFSKHHIFLSMQNVKLHHALCPTSLFTFYLTASYAADCEGCKSCLESKFLTFNR